MNHPSKFRVLFYALNSVLVFFAALLSADGSTASGPAPAARPIRVLIVDGFSNHDWRLTTQLVRGIIEPTGLFTVTVSTAPPTAAAPGWDAWRPAFRDYDVVIQNCNDYGGGPAWPREVRTDFEAFVRGGGGVYIWHSANNAFAD